MMSEYLLNWLLLGINIKDISYSQFITSLSLTLLLTTVTKTLETEQNKSLCATATSFPNSPAEL